MGKWSLMLRAEGTCKHNFLEQREQCLGWGGGRWADRDQTPAGREEGFQTDQATHRGRTCPCPCPCGQKAEASQGLRLGLVQGLSSTRERETVVLGRGKLRVS